MSTYKKVTRHPQTGKWEQAEFRDDYFGPHIYGVYFTSDDKVYPTELVDKKDIKEFWREDVMVALADVLRPWYSADMTDISIKFLNAVEDAYKKRWDRDPLEGEGAVENERKKRDIHS